ncbi:MAG: hypothetical protein IPN62_16635 [Flavobacteriales bacterium]|nr:hypothetical protein [Flavobacteriales bacterium]
MNHTPIRSTVLLGVFIAACSPASAQERNPEERLLLSEAKTLLQAAQQQGRAQTITSIADMEGREVREAPAHVQVISARQIEASGARDLFDVLQLVPASPLRAMWTMSSGWRWRQLGDRRQMPLPLGRQATQ